VRECAVLRTKEDEEVLRFLLICRAHAKKEKEKEKEAALMDKKNADLRTQISRRMSMRRVSAVAAGK
jgi:hypothetical protein